MKKIILNTLTAAAFTAALALGANAATFTVTKTADTNDGVCDADCSLREAIFAANNAAGDDVIEFASGSFGSASTITLTSGEMTISANGSLTINGPGAHLLTLDGNLASRIMTVNRDVVANISGLRFTRGNGVGAINTGRGGALYNVGGTIVVSDCIFEGNAGANGGAFNNAAAASPSVPATATYINCVFRNNTATGSGGVGQNFSTSFLTIRDSTFTGNSSGASIGAGALQANGQVRITNSTFFNNTAADGGGGAIQTNGSLFILTNSTIVGNTALDQAGGLHRGTTNVNAFVRNSIIAGNTGGGGSPDVSNSTGGLTSEGTNIIGVVGTSTGWIGSDILNTDPQLTPIGNHGGLGHTFALLSSSPARNAGQNCVVDLSCPTNNPEAAVTTDQRGAARPFGASVDIGSFEDSTTYVAVLPDAPLGVPYDVLLTPESAGFTYNVTAGQLPPGITINADTAMPDKKGAAPQAALSLTGTPTTPGVYQFTITISEVNAGTNSASVNYQITVPGAAANVSVSGFVSNGGISVLPNSIVSITDGSTTWTTRTNNFGYYSFEGLPANIQYTITVLSKGYTFSPVQITPSGDVTGLIISPNP